MTSKIIMVYMFVDMMKHNDRGGAGLIHAGPYNICDGRSGTWPGFFSSEYETLIATVTFLWSKTDGMKYWRLRATV